MDSQKNPLSQYRELVAQIKHLVDAFERFHKHAQLMGSPLFIPILNESRYLARALTDAWAHAVLDDTDINGQAVKKTNEALVRALHAASSALHDTVDEMLAIIINSIIGIEKELKNKGQPPKLVMYLDGDWLMRYAKFLDAYKSISSQIALSRANRGSRNDLYVEFMRPSTDNQPTQLDVVLDFFLSLRQLELFVFTSNGVKPHGDS